MVAAFEHIEEEETRKCYIMELLYYILCNEWEIV